MLRSSRFAVVRRAPSTEGGGVLIMFALWLGIALAGLMVLDIGHLFWQKREIQKIADLSALAGASVPVDSACQPSQRGVAQANGLRSGEFFQPVPGYWGAGPGGVGVQFQPNVANPNACHVTVKRVVNYFFVWPAAAGSSRELTAQATAVTSARVARLSVRTQLADISSQDSMILNALVGGVLGGNLNVQAMGWQGLLDLDVDLLGYLQALAIQLNVSAGDYDRLLQTEVGVGVLLNALVSAVQQQSGTASVALQALQAIAARAHVSSLRLRLADLLNVQTGLPQEALRTDLNLLQLVQAMVQVGNGNSAVAGTIALPLPGVVGVTAHLQVIEPPKISAIGDPELARQSPRGPNEIFVRSAQTRVLLSVELPAAGVATSVLNALTTLLSPVLTLANIVLGGGIAGMVDAEVLPPPLRVDVSLDVGAGQAHLTDYSCTTPGKSVSMDTTTAVAKARIGKWGDTPAQARANAFSSQSLAAISPIPVVRLDCLGCHGVSRIPQYYGGQGVKLDLPVAESKQSNVRVSPAPSLEEDINWGASISVSKIIASLGPTISALKVLDPLKPDPRASSSGVAGLLNALSGLLGAILAVVNSLFVVVLAPLLDPILDSLLKLLGVKLAGADFGAQLNCGGGAELVF